MGSIVKAKPIKGFISAFAESAHKQTSGIMPASVAQTFLEQMTRHLNGEDVVANMEIEDYGEGHWSVRLVQSLGWSFGTLLPRLPGAESLLFRLHTSHLRAKLRERGTPIGHGAGSGREISGSQLRSRL